MESNGEVGDGVVEERGRKWSVEQNNYLVGLSLRPDVPGRQNCGLGGSSDLPFVSVCAGLKDCQDVASLARAWRWFNCAK